MLGEYFEFVGLMISLLLRGLLDTGEYFVVGVDSRQYNPKTPVIYLEGKASFSKLELSDFYIHVEGTFSRVGPSWIPKHITLLHLLTVNIAVRIHLSHIRYDSYSVDIYHSE